MIEQLVEWDKALFLTLNEAHVEWMDNLMVAISDNIIWLPLYLWMIWLLFQNYGKQFWWWLIAIALTILISDQFTSGFMKPFFARPRPCHDPAIGYLVHIVDRCGGKYGFASSHAANTFGVATLLFITLKPYQRFIGWIFAWSAVVAYSRIYLGVHYPLDVTVGGLVGIGSGYLSYWVIHKSKRRLQKVKPGH